MSDAPLTEKRFLELLEITLNPIINPINLSLETYKQNFEKIDSTLNSFKKEFIIINETLKKLEKFQKIKQIPPKATPRTSTIGIGF
jgi:hypothetical protein